MNQVCDRCGCRYDDEKRWTICPHNPLDVAIDAKYCRKHDLFDCYRCTKDFSESICRDCNKRYNTLTDSALCPHNSLEEVATLQKEEFKTGAVREHLYPPGAHFPIRIDLLMNNETGVRRLAEVYGEGFAKYGAKNWKKGFDQSILLAHAYDHLRLYQSGDESEDHLAHAIWNLFTLCWVEENKPELLDLKTNE